MYYNITIFFTICCHTYRIHHQCYRFESFPDTIMLLKADRFEGFSNQSNVDELVTNATSRCNYKITNFIITITKLTIA